MSKEDEAVPQEQLLKEQYHPFDPTNPFSLSKFIEENNIPLSKREVINLLALDRLPEYTKRWVDDEFIDMLTAYELSKFENLFIKEITVDYRRSTYVKFHP